MATIVDKRSARGRTRQSASHVLVISAILVAILSTGLLIGRQLIASKTPNPAEQYRGLVQLAPDQDGRCSRFELDNRTGFMWPKGDTPCGDITTALPTPSSGSLDRFHSIAEHFRGH